MTYICPEHNIELSRGVPCPMCEADFRRDITDWTPTGRARELKRIIDMDIVTVEVALLRDWISRLMGRSVFTHEFADPDCLLRELESGEQATLDDVMLKGVARWGDNFHVIDLREEK